MRLFKKGVEGVPWWLVTLLFASALLFFLLFMVSASKKGMFSNILAIFKRW